MNNDELIKSIKEDVYEWSGFQLNGETKEELKSSLDTIHNQLSNSISDRAYSFEASIRRIKEEEE
jgi:hypothetical protein